MGVPVVTRAGDRHASRVGASLLSTVGQGALVATSDDDFVRIATALAEDVLRPSTGSTRAQDLRDAMARSALCDVKGLADRFTAALEAMCVGDADHA